MTVPSKPGVTVILEDAYKQNTVYRPWKDITSGEKLDKNPIPPIKPGESRYGSTATR